MSKLKFYCGSIAKKCFDIWGILKMATVHFAQSGNNSFGINHIITCRSKLLQLGFSKFVLVLILYQCKIGLIGKNSHKSQILTILVIAEVHKIDLGPLIFGILKIRRKNMKKIRITAEIFSLEIQYRYSGRLNHIVPQPEKNLKIEFPC